MIDNHMSTNQNTPSDLGKTFTKEELRDIQKPRTLFRRTLVERTREEFEQNPQLGLRLGLVLEEAQIADLDYRQRKITEQEYLERIQQLRKDLGNIVYQ